MPIYAYRCESCDFGKDVLQKISDPQLSQCPECGKDTFRKQVTAAGFQLKGSGWYVTDFRGGNNGGANAPAKPDANGASNGASSDNASANNGATQSDAAPASSTAATPSAPAAAPAASASSSGSGST